MEHSQGEMISPVNNSSKQHFILYKRRWYMLAVVVMFNISNAIIWLSFAPVANYSASFFDKNETTVNFFSLVYFIVFIPCCVLSWWIIENLGFKFAVIFGTTINALGAILRIVGAFAFPHPNNKFIVVLTGQVLAASSQPLVLSMPTKLAALWFGDHERTIANTIASMANPLGALLANAFATVIVHEVSDVAYMIAAFGAPAFLAWLMAVFGFHLSKPPTPPAASALIEPTSFFTGFRQLLSNKDFMLLALTTGCGIGAFSTVSTIIQQLICPQNYSDVIASVAGALLIAFGFIGSAITGVYVDKTRNYIDVSKILAMLVGLSGALIIVSSSIRDQPVFLIFSFSMFGFTALALLPVVLELGVECTYPVDEATSAGMQWAMGQLIGALMLIMSLTASPKLSDDRVKKSSCVVENTHGLEPVDLTYPNMALIIVCIVCVILFVIRFDTPYRRLLEEKKLESHENTTNYNAISD